jgi:hypothetical protein
MVYYLDKIKEMINRFPKSTPSEAILFARMATEHNICGYAFSSPDEATFQKDYDNYNNTIPDYIIVFSSRDSESSLVVHLQTEIFDIPYDLDNQCFDDLEDYILDTIREASVKDYPYLVSFIDSDVYISNIG